MAAKTRKAKGETEKAIAADATRLRRAKLDALRARIRGDADGVRRLDARCNELIRSCYSRAGTSQAALRAANAAISKAMAKARDTLSAQEMDALAETGSFAAPAIAAPPAQAAIEVAAETPAPERPSCVVIPFRPRAK